ncbi:MAG: chromate transporter [Clostridia bacterium]|nr:chromate transporter [Clostridia bacterium]
MIFLMLFIEFFKVGLFTFGGGFAMIPLIEDIVVSYGWLTEAEFYNLIGICESTPGPVAINMATYIGSEQGGLFGSFCATLGVVLPSFIIIVLIAAILKNFTENRFFRGFIRGVKPVVAALILATGTTLLLKNIGISLSGTFTPGWAAIIVLAAVTALYFFFKIVFKKKLSAIQIILISAVLGVLVCNIISP